MKYFILFRLMNTIIFQRIIFEIQIFKLTLNIEFIQFYTLKLFKIFKTFI